MEVSHRAELLIGGGWNLAGPRIGGRRFVANTHSVAPQVPNSG